MTVPVNERRDVARRLRSDMPLAERRLWSRLRRSALGYRFRRQYPVGDYVADFACVAGRLIVEVDGDSHYANQNEKAYDDRRTAFLEANGWCVLRVTNTEVRDDIEAVCGAVRAACDRASRSARL